VKRGDGRIMVQDQYRAKKKERKKKFPRPYLKKQAEQVGVHLQF
jgi:hypothetical protein